MAGGSDGWRWSDCLGKAKANGRETSKVALILLGTGRAGEEHELDDCSIFGLGHGERKGEKEGTVDGALSLLPPHRDPQYSILYGVHICS